MDLLRFVIDLFPALDLADYLLGFWKIIHGILDPVVASKVHFISGPKELEKLIPPEHIIKELGGQENWEYKYIEPISGENDRLKDTETRDRLLTERMNLGNELYKATAEWISGDKSDDLLSRRKEIVEKLRANYWEVDPYIRARSLMDRTGVIQEGGKIDFYPPQATPVKVNENEKAEIMTEHAENAQPVATAVA